MRNLISLKSILMSFCVLAVLVFPTTQNAWSSGQCATLHDLEINPECTAISFGLDGTIKTKSFNLENPARWVLDITPAKWSGEISSKLLPKSKTYFTEVRAGQWQNQTARLVIHSKGKIPKIDITDSRISVLFEDTKGDLLAKDAIPQLPVPENKEKPSENKVVEISRFLTTNNPSDKNLVEVPKLHDTSTVPGKLTDTIPTAGTPVIHREKSNQFEIESDGASTVIRIPLSGDQSFDVRRDKFPDRLTVEYPSRKGTTDVRFTTIGKENMPVGIIESFARFESVNPENLNKLVFYSTDKFNYQTSVVSGKLQITVQRKSPLASNDTGDKSTQLAKTESPFVTPLEVVEIPRVAKSAGTTPSAEPANLLESMTPSGSVSEKEKTQKFEPVDRKSFEIEKPVSTTGHTLPESGLGIRLNNVETNTNPIATSVSELKDLLPKMAEPRLSMETQTLENINETPTITSSGPMMIDPPTADTKDLPKGTRPAADLFLTTGESVILPVKNLVRASVGNPEVLIVNVLSQEELLITAKGEGQTTLILWEDGVGRSVRWVNVGRSTLMKTLEVERIIANPDIKVNFVGASTIVLEGKVKTEEQLKRAAMIASGAADKVVNLIEMSDPKQVLVKVRFVEIQTKDKEELLRQFGSGTRTEGGEFQFNILSDILNPELASGGIFDISLHPGIIHGNVGDELFDPLDFMLSALEQERRGKILSQPNIVTMSGHEAMFRVGGEIPYTYQNENGFNVVDFREFGVELKVTPIVDSNNNINLAVYPVVRVPDFTLAIAGIPGFKTREVQTNLQIGDGQTIVVGGLLQHETTTIKSKVPILGDVPLLGELFRSKTTNDEETELLIFLTPMVLKDISAVESQIIDDSDVSLSPYYKREVIEPYIEQEDED